MEQVTQPFELEKALELVLRKVTEEQERQSFAAPVLLCISGIDCSGKSTLALALTERAKEAGAGAELVHNS